MIQPYRSKKTLASIRRCLERAFQRAVFSVLMKNQGQVPGNDTEVAQLQEIVLKVCEHAESLGWLTPEYGYIVPENYN